MILVHEQKFIASGKLIRDAEMSTFGSKGYHKTRLVVGTGNKEDPPLYATAMFDLADATADLKKGDIVLLAGLVKSREWNGKRYTDYEIDGFAVQGKSAPSERKDDEWTNINTEEVPF
jgi:hypothetical protein